MVESENYPLAARNTKRKNKNSTTRRFSDEQIRSLESLFKLEAKLEPRKKLQMAKELDLQPRQVAIWFQNKRARWKSKQIEQEYRSLKADYDDLHSRFESLKVENQSLLIQYKKLSNQLNNKPCDGSKSVTVSKDLDGNSTDSGSENGGTNFELKGKNSCSLISGGLMDHDMVMYSDDEEIRRDGNTTGYLAQIIEESEFDDRADHGFSQPREKLSRIDSDGLFDQLCGTSNWWDFWT